MCCFAKEYLSSSFFSRNAFDLIYFVTHHPGKANWIELLLLNFWKWSAWRVKRTTTVAVASRHPGACKLSPNSRVRSLQICADEWIILSLHCTLKEQSFNRISQSCEIFETITGEADESTDELPKKLQLLLERSKQGSVYLGQTSNQAWARSAASVGKGVAKHPEFFSIWSINRYQDGSPRLWIPLLNLQTLKKYLVSLWALQTVPNSSYWSFSRATAMFPSEHLLVALQLLVL